MTESTFTLVVHGGAGSLSNEVIARGRQREAREGLNLALREGFDTLEAGGSSLDAVERAVRVLEDCPLFNAGKGAAFNHDGAIELDASIMDGRSLAAGAVAGVTTVRNPISAARAVMEKSPHVLLVGQGADQFAAEIGLPTVKSSYFWTPERWEQLQKELNRNERAQEAPGKHGTVGAVALDRQGNLAAATSTGGISNKRFGRVGDSPIIGAGTYAENGICAVSCTGQGEFFLRFVVAHEIACLVKYGGLSVAQATAGLVHGRLPAAGGEGGVIAVDARGVPVLEFNTEGMYRGYIQADGDARVSIFRD